MATLAPTATPIAEKAKNALFRPIGKEEWRRFGNWFLVWIVLANIGFAAMWLIGAPPRNPEIMASGAIGLVVRTMPVWVRCTAFLAAITYSILGFIAGLLSLSIVSLLYSLKFFAEIKPTQSADYMVGGGLLVGIIVLAFWMNRRDQAFADLRLVILGIAATVGLAHVDVQMGKGMRGHYARAAEAGTPFVSAGQNSGFAAVPFDGSRNLMIIVVESLGEPVGNKDMSELLFARYKDAAVTNRYALSTGDTTYFNSTTAAEVRELCGRWGDYYELLDEADASCLPARLAKAGYQTRAYHSFTGGFFERTTWYPNIGFQKSEFAEDLLARGTRECGGVFPGVCDRDVPALIAQDLKAAKGPQFVYWLTVNSHLPVPPGMNLEVDRCERISAGLAENYPMICRQFALWDQLDQAIIKEITAADFPQTDILIVGDHMPPYYDRHHRSQFAPDRVPWLLLKAKDVEPVARADEANIAAQVSGNGTKL